MENRVTYTQFASSLVGGIEESSHRMRISQSKCSIQPPGLSWLLIPSVPLFWLARIGHLLVRLPIDVFPLLGGERPHHPAEMDEVELLRPSPRLCNVVNFKDAIWSGPALRCRMKINSNHID